MSGFVNKIQQVREDLIGELWSNRSLLADVEEEISKINRELEDLEEIKESYSRAQKALYSSLDNRTTKLTNLENLGEKSKSARTYSVCLRDRLRGNSVCQKIEDFDNVWNLIMKEINTREDKLANLMGQKEMLENKVYSTNRSLSELEDK